MFKWSRKRVYLDYAGAMPVLQSAREAFLAALHFEGNPGALHREATEAAKVLQDARAHIAHELGSKAHEIIFTSGGTEGNNLAILGLFKRILQEGKDAKDTHWIVSAIEHPSLLECFEYIKERGGLVTVLAPSAEGRISVASLTEALRKETVCVSIGWANGEVGVVQPMSALSQAIRAYEKEQGTTIIFHSDAGQAPLYISPQVHTLGVDICTLDGGKLGSPRGVGALFVRAGVALAPIFYGGSQEAGLRPGTENVALAAGFAAAMKSISDNRKKEAARLEAVREHLLVRMAQAPMLQGSVINGGEKHHLPHIINISVPGIDNEYIVLALDRAGFALATKSACKEGEKSSHVVLSLAKEGNEWRASSALRISMGMDTKEDDIERLVSAFSGAVAEYRAHG